MSALKLHPLMHARVAETRQKREQRLSLLKEELIAQNQGIVIALDKLHRDLGVEALLSLRKIHETIIIGLQKLDSFEEFPIKTLSALSEMSESAGHASDAICSVFSDELKRRACQAQADN